MTKKEIQILLSEHGYTGKYSGKEKKWFLVRYESSNPAVKAKQPNLSALLTKLKVPYEILQPGWKNKEQ